MKEKISSALENKYIVLLICIVFVLLSTLYHYGLQTGFLPCSEDLITIWKCYKSKTFQIKYSWSEYLYDFLAMVCTEIGGMSYFSLRLFFSLFYMMLLTCTVYLSIKKKDGRGWKVWILPLCAMFMVVLHPADADGDRFGYYVWDTDLIAQWPYNYHYTPRVFAAVVLCIISKIITDYQRKEKHPWVWILLIGLFTVYACFKTNLLFYLMIPAPVFLTIFFRGLHSEKYRKWIICLIGLGAIGLIFARIFPVGMLDGLWKTEQVARYGAGAIYGESNWIGLDRLIENVIYYMKNILDLFNIQIQNNPVISLFTIVYLCKLLLLLAGYAIFFRIVVCSITGQCEKYNYDFVDEILAWTYFILSAAIMFSDMGEKNDTIRYMPGLVSIMCIIVCRNIETMISFPKQTDGENAYGRFVLILCSTMVCVCTMNKVWNFHATDSYDESCKAVIGNLKSTDLGYGLAPKWLYARLSAMTEGELVFYSSLDELESCMGEDAKAAYLITNFEWTWDEYVEGYAYFERFTNFDELCEKYSEPTYVVNYEKFNLCVYENGMRK